MTRRVTFGPNAQMTSQSKITLKNISFFMFLRRFSPAHKKCKKLFRDNFLQVISIYHIFAKLSHYINPKCFDKNVSPLYLTCTPLMTLQAFTSMW